MQLPHPLSGARRAILESVCKKINFGYRDPGSIRQEDFANREAEGVLHVRKAGEMLCNLKKQPKGGGWGIVRSPAG